VVVLALLCFTASSQAQAPTAVVNGQVRDSSGAAIPNATVEIINDATHVRYTTETNSEGIYSVPNLPPGTYHIQVSKTGFKTIIHPDVVLHVQDADAIGFTLPVGPTSDTVTVEGGAPLVNTENAAVSTVIDRQFVESLPLNGRSFNTLLQLTPGVVIARSNSNSPSQFSVAGQRTDANNFLVDGVSANFGVVPTAGLVASGLGQAQAFSALGGTSGLVSVEALQEFRIETSSFAPEFGRSPGGQVILTTRSGTNDFHGGIYEYFRNDVLDANDWFTNRAGSARPAERHNDFGGYLGGRVLKDSTFFFLSYEGARLRQPQSRQITVPSLGARSSAPPQVAPFLNGFPLPNGPASGNTAQFTGSYSSPATLDAGSARIDHTFNSRFSIFGRYSDAPSQTIARASGLSQLNTISVNTQTITIEALIQFSTQLSNSLRGNYSKQNSSFIESLDSFGWAVPPDSHILFGNLSPSNNLASVLLLGIGLYGSGPSGRNKATQLNFADDVAHATGGHQLKFGGDYRAIYLDHHSYEHQLFYLASIAGLSATGKANLSTQTANPTQLLSPALSLYGQDTWKVRPRFTLTYGLRWELNPPPTARGNSVLGSWTNVNNPATTALAPLGTAVWNTTYDKFAPRVGLAYSLTQKGDFVLRSGFGIFYDLGVGESGQITSSFPNFGSGFFAGVSLPIADATPFLPVLSPNPPYTGTIFAFSSDLSLPRSYQWNVALEKSLGGRQVVSATYVGQTGRDLLRQSALSKPNSNFAAGSVFDLTGNSASSNYHALQVQYRRPLADRLQVLLNYTWSHSIDNVSDDTVLVISDAVFANQNDRSSSSFDVRHSFSGGLTYAPPAAARSGPLSVLTGGWSIESLVVARSGFPFNAVVVGVPSPALGTSLRPDLVPGQPIWITDSTAPGRRRLNSLAFMNPPPTRQGTEGRNDIRGFGLTQVDLSIGRKFSFTERWNLQLRADAFNVLNHPNFTDPSPLFSLTSPSMLNQGLGGLNPLFQQGGPRSLQLSLKFVF